MKIVCRFICMSCLCMASIVGVIAQETDAEPATASTQSQATVQQAASDPDAAAIIDLLDQLKSLKDEIAKLDEALQQATGEEVESLLLQRRDLYERVILRFDELGELGKNYVADGGDLNAVLADFRNALLRVGAEIRADIDRQQNRLEENRADRKTDTQDGVEVYVHENQQIDMGYSLLSGYIDVIRTLSFDPAPSVNYMVENLPRRADHLAGRIRLWDEREKKIKHALQVNPDSSEDLSKQSLVEELMAADTKSLQLTVDLARKEGLEMSQYQTLLIKTTGDLNTNLLDANVVGVLLEEWWLGIKHSFRNNAIDIFFKIVVFLLILFFFRMLSFLVTRIIRKSVESARVNLSALLQKMLVSWASRLIMFMGILVALAQLGVSLGPVLAGVGVAGFVIGFALQDTLGNFAAGMMILVYRPYDEGDMVEAGGVFGKVKSMSIVSTTILTVDNQTLIIPNSKIWGDVIKNVTAQAVRRVDMTFGIGYGDDIPKAEKILAEIVSKHEKVLEEPAPVIKLHNLGESSVDFIVRPWAKTVDYWEVYWDVTREVKMRFDAEGVSIPFPQRDVHIYSTAGNELPA